MITVNSGSIQGTEWILKGSLGDVVVPLQRVQEDKLMKATLNLNDLSKIKFPTVTNPTGGGPNHSVWMDGADVTTSLTEESAIKSSDFMKNKRFSLRWVVYPTSGQTAFLGLSMAPGSPERLEAEAKLRKKNVTDTTIPACAVKLCPGKGGGVTVEVPMGPTTSAQGLASFKG